MAQQYAEKIDNLLQPYVTTNFHYATKQEAKAIISDVARVQKELRLIKKEIGLEEAAIRNQYTVELNNIRSGAVMNRFVRGFFGRLARAGTASARANLAKQKQARLVPYEGLRSYIDSKLVALDRLKLDIEQKSLGMAPAPARSKPVAMPPQNALSGLQAPVAASFTTQQELQYFKNNQQQSNRVTEALKGLASLGTNADFTSVSWVTSMRIALGRLHEVNMEIMAAEPPPRYAAVHREVFAAAIAREEMIELNEKFFTSMDPQYIEQASVKMKESTAATNRALALVQAMPEYLAAQNTGN